MGREIADLRHCKVIPEYLFLFYGSKGEASEY